MSLNVSVVNPADTDSLEQWLLLGERDPNRLSPGHEKNLILFLSMQGGKLVLAKSQNQPIARCLAFPLLPRDGIVSLGFLAFAETPEDLLNSALTEMIKQVQTVLPAKKLVGPMNGTTWFSYRLRIDQHPSTFSWEPTRQPLLEKLLNNAGFSPFANYHSTATKGLKQLQLNLAKDYQRVKDLGFTLKPILPADLNPQMLQEIHRLSMIGFQENPLFVPISFEVFAKSYLEDKTTKDNYFYAAFDSKGACAAYFLAFLEPAHGIEKRTLILKTATTDTAHRRLGLSNALLYVLCNDLPNDISDNYYSALVFKGWKSESYSRHGEFLWVHEYQLLSKDLS